VNIAAEKLWRKGARKVTADLFLAGAKCGDRSCQLNAGYFRVRGIGVRRNSSAALTWYKRAYRQDDARRQQSWYDLAGQT
jgi:TPR repeat protein